MCEGPCKLRGAFKTVDLREPYTVTHRNQGNGGAKTAPRAGYSTTLKS
jgi:hypothetical protein